MRISTFRTALAVSLLYAGSAAAQPTPPEEAPPVETPPPAETPVETVDASVEATATAEPTGPDSTSTKLPPHGEPEPADTALLKLAGHVASTFNYNLMDPAGGVTPLHSYTAPHNTFLLNQAHVALTGADDHFSYAVEIDAGTDAVINSGGSYFDIQEAYVTYTADSGLGFKAGKFVTFNGIEVIESPANPTISRGFLFGLAEPYTHVGALGTYKISDTLDVALGAVSGWDLIVDNNDNKTIVAKLGVTKEKLGLVLSSYAGKETNNTDWRATFDATAVLKLTKMDLWLQGNVGFEEGVAAMGEDGMWLGFGVQPVYHVDDKLSLCGRLEAFLDGDGARTGAEQTLVNVSVTPSYMVHEHVTVRFEGRLDFSTEDVFVNADGDAGAMQVIALSEASVAF